MLVKVTIEEMTYDNMVKQLKKAFINNSVGKSSSGASGIRVKEEDSEEIESGTFYGSQYRLNRYGPNNKFQQQTYRKPVPKKRIGRNLLDIYGNVTRCRLCDSINHWEQSCPDRKNVEQETFREGQKKSSSTFVESDNEDDISLQRTRSGVKESASAHSDGTLIAKLPDSDSEVTKVVAEEVVVKEELNVSTEKEEVHDQISSANEDSSEEVQSSDENEEGQVQNDDGSNKEEVTVKKKPGRPTENYNKVTSEDRKLVLKAGDSVRYKTPGQDQWIFTKIHSRAGKVKGVHSGAWNILNAVGDIKVLEFNKEVSDWEVETDIEPCNTMWFTLCDDDTPTEVYLTDNYCNQTKDDMTGVKPERERYGNTNSLREQNLVDFHRVITWKEITKFVSVEILVTGRLQVEMRIVRQMISKEEIKLE